MKIAMPFSSPDDDAGTAGGDPDANEFVSESASVAFNTAPDDTTAGIADDAEVAPSETSASAAEATATAEADGEAVAAPSPGAKPAVQAKSSAAPAAKPKGKQTLDGRVAEKTKEIDRLTHQAHKTKAEITRDEARATALRTEIAALEAKKLSTGAAAPAASAGVKPDASGSAAKPEDLEPKAPKYRDFATDEEYETAFSTWQGAHGAWNHRQLEALKGEITQGLESRLTSADDAAAARSAMGTMVTTLDKVRNEIADWHDATEAIKDLASAWYDPARHGPSPTPFLSDLSQTLMMEGNAEGAHLLHWLGLDPDRAQRVADLRPSRPMRDALVNAPSVIPLLEFFATDAGATHFAELKQMHPVRMMQAVGALYTRLQPVPSGSGKAAHPITQARPSARPPAGTPGARGAPSAPADGKPTDQWVDWMADEDAKETAAKLRAAGLPVPA